MGRVRLENSEWTRDHNKKMAHFNQAIAKSVKFAIKHTTVTEFAKRIHYTRSTLSSLLNTDGDPAKRQKPWTLSTLKAVADELGCPLSVLIAEAEKVMGGEEPGLSLRVAGTEEHSRERLQRLIYLVVGYDGDVDKKNMDGLLEVLYRLENIEYATPEFCKLYYEGKISDQEVLFLLEEAVHLQNRLYEKISDSPDNPPGIPFWAAVKEVWETKDKIR